jgi:DHA1 family bicyclomycin/chloramphenicol resistance-like MFS transporter
MILPPIWIIVLLVGLPQLSETIYTPSLPEIAKDLDATPSSVEHTLSIFLLGLALGAVFWGTLSDRIGRKPCILLGVIVFICGCIGCYFAKSIKILLIARLIQALGCSIGSVLGQAISRDAFSGPNLGKVFSSIGVALSLFPAIGPTIGGFIAEKAHWSTIFLVMISFGILLIIITIYKLPETLDKTKRQKHHIFTVAKSLVYDKRVILYGMIIGCTNGISFSYFSEGSFFMMDMLGMKPSHYGMSFILSALATMIGGMISGRLQHLLSAKKIMELGMLINLTANSIFSLIIMINYYFSMINNQFTIYIVLLMRIISMLGIAITIINSLALSLVDYRYCIGAASSLFSLFYYLLISFFTFLIGYLHNGTLLVMPLYFFVLSVGIFICSIILGEDKKNY